MRWLAAPALAVDAVGVDLEQDGDAVAGAAGNFGGGDPGVQPEGDGGVPQVIRAAGQRRCLWGARNLHVL